MDSRVKELLAYGDKLFGKREDLCSLWQELADHFYPERANFTHRRSLGEDFASNLMTSYPLMARRELGNTFSTMLRADEWFKLGVSGEADHEGKAWLEWATGLQRRAMYDRRAQFVRATKEADHDFASFGQAVISIEIQPDRTTLLYRCWHLRDVAWAEGLDGAVETVHRKWTTATASELVNLFGDKVHAKVREKAAKEPYCEIRCRHIVTPASKYQGEVKYMTPLVSIYVDEENGHVMQERGVRVNPYVIPRWQTVSGSQYSYSPATVCALPDARLIQAMTLTLLNAGEKASDPPMVAVQEALRSDINVRAGGVTWVDAAYDERLGEVLRPISQDRSALPFNMEMVQDMRDMIRKAFYLDKLDLPQRGPEMTAYEVAQRVQQYVRDALPLFEPVESDYNGGLCDRTFDVLMGEGAFGPPESLPRSLGGRDVEFTFTSPLRDAIDKQKADIFMQAGSILQTAGAIDPSIVGLIDTEVSVRDVLEGMGVPTNWTRSAEALAAQRERDAAAAQEQQMIALAQQGSEVAKNLGVTA